MCQGTILPVSFDGRLFLGLLALLGAMQVVCWLLAKGLGRRLERHVMVLGIALPLVLLFPWIDRARLLVPADILQQGIPLAPGVAATHRHDLLNDTVYQFLPWELEVRHALRDLRLPLWSDELEGGSSPWINPQASPVSPIAMPARALPIQHFLLVTLALKILVAFQGTWVLARTVGVSRRSSLLAGAGFALGGGMMAWALFPHTATLAWVPWLTAAVIRLFRGGGARDRSRTGATAAVLTAALLLSGHPETAAVGGLFAAMCGLSLARYRRKGSLVRGLGSAVLAAALGFGLVAPHVLPFVLHLPHSQRAQETLVRELPPYYVSLQDPWTWFLPGFGRYILSPLNPRVFGRPYLDEFRGPFNWADAESGYTGLVAFAGSAVALLALRRRRSWPFLGFAALSLLLAAQSLPLAHAIYSVEALKTVAWSRTLLVGCLALAIAGGMGMDRLLRARSPRRALLGWIAVAGAAALSLLAYADPYVIALWILIAVSAFLGWKRPKLAAAGLALVLVLDLGPWARSHLPESDPALFYPATGFMAFVKREATEGGPWRVVGEDRILFPSLLAVYGIADVRTHNPLAPMPYLRTLEAAFGFAPTTVSYFPAFRGIDHPFLDFLNVRVVASVSAFEPPRTMERIDAGRFEHYRLYRNPDALPRWFLPSAAAVIRQGDVGRWVSSLKDPRVVAVFDRRAAGWVGEGGEVRVASLSPGRIALDVPGSGDRLLATSLLMPEGWRAGPFETVVVNGAFVGVHVPPGASRVELRFVPPGFVAGLAIGGLALLATVLLVLLRRA